VRGTRSGLQISPGRYEQEARSTTRFPGATSGQREDDRTPRKMTMNFPRGAILAEQYSHRFRLKSGDPSRKGDRTAKRGSAIERLGPLDRSPTRKFALERHHMAVVDSLEWEGGRECCV